MIATIADMHFLNKRDFERNVASSDYAAVGRLAATAVKGEFNNQEVVFMQMRGDDMIYQTRDRETRAACLIVVHRSEQTVELKARMPVDRTWWTRAELREAGIS